MCIISNSAQKRNIPLTRGDFIASYRKKNRAIRHEYYTLATRYRDMDKAMFTFTVKGRGTYTKLRLINEIKSYVTYLIANSTAEIYFFSNIELGHSFTNPHLHTQLWCNNKNALEVIYDKVIAKFSLNKKYCSLSEPQQTPQHYDYVLKDYSEHITDDRLYELEQIKKKYRKQLGLKLRFYSRSKSKYTSAAYKYFYRYFGVLREFADGFMDWFFSLFFKKKRVFKLTISSFITIKRTRGFAMCKVCTLVRNSYRPMSFWMCVPANAPPISLFYLTGVLIFLKEVVMFILRLFFTVAMGFVLYVVRVRSPTLFCIGVCVLSITLFLFILGTGVIADELLFLVQ